MEIVEEVKAGVMEIVLGMGENVYCIKTLLQTRMKMVSGPLHTH